MITGPDLPKPRLDAFNAQRADALVVVGAAALCSVD